MAVWVKPTAGSISSPFGWRGSPGGIGSTNHLGADIACGVGTAVVASAAGTVVFAGESGGYGYLVIIDHGNGHRTYYAHLSHIAVRYGQQVVQGQVIAASGGKKGAPGAGTSTGPHLHTEHRINGVAKDPVPYWTAVAGNGSQKIEVDMPLTDTDAQTVAKTQIILPAPWGQASIAETLAGTRSRAEDTYLMVSALTAAVSALAQGQGMDPQALSAMVASKVERSLADDFARVESLLSGAVASLSDADAARLAKAVNDDAARRMKE